MALDFRHERSESNLDVERGDDGKPLDPEGDEEKLARFNELTTLVWYLKPDEPRSAEQGASAPPAPPAAGAAAAHLPPHKNRRTA